LKDKDEDEDLEAWFRQNITDTEPIKWYKTKIVQLGDWLDKFEKAVEEKEAREKPHP